MKNLVQYDLGVILNTRPHICFNIIIEICWSIFHDKISCKCSPFTADVILMVNFLDTLQQFSQTKTSMIMLDSMVYSNFILFA